MILKKEFQILTTLRSPHVVFFYGMCLNPLAPQITKASPKQSPNLSQSVGLPLPSPTQQSTQPAFVLEWCSGGSLCSLLQKETEKITWDTLFDYALQIVGALSTLHNYQPSIVHRDLKTQNILISESGKLRVCDFGLSRTTSATMAGSTLGKLRGTYQYTAPEVYKNIPYSIKSDIYSIGVILWEMVKRVMTGKYEQPFTEFPNIFADFQIIVLVAKEELRPTLPATTPVNLLALINRAWDSDPDQRPTADQLEAQLAKLRLEYESDKANWDSLLPK
jgi:serine/threonine protein kinase